MSDTKPRIRYTTELAEKICERIAVNAESLTSICKTPGMPSYRAVMEWRECPENGGMTTREVRSVGSIAGWGNADAMGVAVDCDRR